LGPRTVADPIDDSVDLAATWKNCRTKETNPMSFTSFTLRQKGDVAVIDLHGKSVQHKGCRALQETIGKLVETGSTRVLLNLADINSIDNSGLLELVLGCADIARAGGQLKLLNVSKHVRTRLLTTGLCAVFETQEDEESAIRSLSAAATARFAPGSEYFLG
jgi:anti-sigma B factor antagonist